MPVKHSPGILRDSGGRRNRGSEGVRGQRPEWRRFRGGRESVPTRKGARIGRPGNSIRNLRVTEFFERAAVFLDGLREDFFLGLKTFSGLTGCFAGAHRVHSNHRPMRRRGLAKNPGDNGAFESYTTMATPSNEVAVEAPGLIPVDHI